MPRPRIVALTWQGARQIETDRSPAQRANGFRSQPRLEDGLIRPAEEPWTGCA
jgi:hypothetical protein